MKNIVVLGAGMVAGAHVDYLLQQPDFHVTVASRTLAKAEALVKDHPRGCALQLDSDDQAAVEALVRDSSLAVSLLPYAYHPMVARLCIAHGVPMVTTSYVKPAMAELDGQARAAGIILLNEIGVDPGIDHMTAMRVIHRVQNQGGRIAKFVSWCGGLPAPESNDNPLGYKFSWSPRGVLLAGKNPAHYLWDGAEVTVPGDELFDHYVPVPVQVEGRTITYEGYPNRDSLPYMLTYGIDSAQTFFRGTLRNQGWCHTLRKVADLGLLDDQPHHDLPGLTYADLTARLAGSDGQNLLRDLTTRLGVAPESPVIANLAWLGFLDDSAVPTGLTAPIDILTAAMLERMRYQPGQRDMLILKHEFEAVYPDRCERIIATMVDFGIPDGDTSMARTVGLPAAIAVKLILCGAIDLTGVQVPVVPQIYEPVLTELEEQGINFVETWETLS